MANGFLAAALAADSWIAVEPDLRWEGTRASALELPLARTTHRGARAARRTRSDACHSRGPGDHRRAAFAAGIDRGADCRRAGPDSKRVARAAPGVAARAIVPAAKPKAEVKPQRNAVARAAPAKAPMRAGEPGPAAPVKIPKPAAPLAASTDRPRGQAEGRGQARTKRRGPCGPCESAHARW